MYKPSFITNILYLTAFVVAFLSSLSFSQQNVNDIPGYYYEESSAYCSVTDLGETTDRNGALQRIEEIQSFDSTWTEYLPCCPMRTSEINESDWERSDWFLGCFHSGASMCYRQKWFSDGDSGQQCCYDFQGQLINSGSGAGTPDFFAPDQDQSNHNYYDVAPWKELSLNEYHEVWKPNQGCDAPFRIRVYGFDEWTYTFLWVDRGDTLIFSEVTGEVMWGFNGSMTGPEGDEILGESAIGWLLLPTKMMTAPTGALIGTIYQVSSPTTQFDTLYYDKMTLPFYIGAGTAIQTPANGFLLLGVNDGVVEDNEGFFDVKVHRVR